MSVTPRTRADRCPGVFRPWPADDGLLVRLRLIGGRLPSAQLAALVDLAERHGDGRVRPTLRANVQLRALPGVDGRLDPEVVSALEATGLVPSPAHDLVRNVTVSPQTGLAGGRADLRPVAGELDRLVRASELLATLPGRFLFVLDDGRGDLMAHDSDLGLVVLTSSTAQLRIGDRWGPVVDLAEAPASLAAHAEQFVRARGEGPDAAWHVAELDSALVEETAPDPRLPEPVGPLQFGPVPGGIHVPVGDDGIDRAWLGQWINREAISEVVVTPWRGVLVPHPTVEEDR